MTNPLEDSDREFALKELNKESNLILNQDYEWIKKPVRDWTDEQKITFTNDMHTGSTIVEILRIVQDIRDGQINHD